VSRLLQVPDNVLKAREDTKATEAEAQETFAGVDGGTTISANARPPADLKFGAIKQRTLDDAVALRQKLSASQG
jgi:hypothetical protein